MLDLLTSTLLTLFGILVCVQAKFIAINYLSNNLSSALQINDINLIFDLSLDHA